MGDTGALLLIGGAVALYAFTTARAAGNLIFAPGRITGLSLDGMSPVIIAELKVQNTSNVDFTLNSLAGNLSTDNTLIGNASDFIPAQIKGNSQTIIPITLTLLPLGIVDNIINILVGGYQKKELIFDGSVNANGQQVPLLLKFNIGG